MKETLGVAGRLIVGAAFIYSGFGKAIGPTQEFAAVLEGYYVFGNVLPQSWLLPAATIEPWLQLVFGVFLVSGYLTRLSAATLTAHLAAFLAAIAYTKWIGNPLSNCGCFGSVHFSPTNMLILDALLIALAATAYLYGTKRWSLDNWIEGNR